LLPRPPSSPLFPYTTLFRSFFCGVPTTMAAGGLALAVLIGLPVSGLWQLAGVALLAFAMVSSFPYAQRARLLRLPPWLWALPVPGAPPGARAPCPAVAAGRPAR